MLLKKLVFLLTGKGRSGKDHLATQMITMFPYTHWGRYAFADKVRDDVRSRFPVTNEQWEFVLQGNKESPMDFFDGKSYRDVNLEIANENKEKYGSGYYAEHVIQRILDNKHKDFHIVTDFGFDSEAFIVNTLKDLGFDVIVIGVFPNPDLNKKPVECNRKIQPYDWCFINGFGKTRSIWSPSNEYINDTMTPAIPMALSLFINRLEICSEEHHEIFDVIKRTIGKEITPPEGTRWFFSFSVF